MADPLQTAELARRLQETEAELARVRTRLRRLESSSAVQLAQALVAGARDPRRAPVTVPREVARLAKRWRARGSSAPLPLDPPPPPAPAGPPAATAVPADRLAARLAEEYAVVAVPRTRPVVAGVLPPSAVAEWQQAAILTVLRPDDALAVLALAPPEVLVVDASAGASGPWAHLGSWAAPERERALLALLSAAGELGARRVLCGAAGGWPALQQLFDAVVAESDAAAVLAGAAA
ncbi:hypothetical protein EV189_1983 [Motilibacter rhizosphaerae]|uniref:Uncharacterized protein n=1 Tax=Motilibacter rhizosphaerae TaxID=598652 RepID=A0A4V2F4R1_9ACTN|nr:hypothetical protein [Motilibacter rhizosphaerae]RZS90199.1 hypothetical protein EV189_1983 [Motilibacter rhizosphaerae]